MQFQSPAHISMTDIMNLNLKDGNYNYANLVAFMKTPDGKDVTAFS